MNKTMSIEERAVECCMKHFPQHDSADAESMRLGYIQGATDQDPISRAEQKKIDIENFSRSCNAINLMHYLDEHRPKDKMCLSNMECGDLEKAFMSGDWAKVIRYIVKYQTMEE